MLMLSPSMTDAMLKLLKKAAAVLSDHEENYLVGYHLL